MDSARPRAIKLSHAHAAESHRETVKPCLPTFFVEA